MSVLGREDQLDDLDERLANLNITNPDEVDDIAGRDLRQQGSGRGTGTTTTAPGARSVSREMARTYGDQLDEVAEFLGKFANQITQLGPTGYLQAMAHKRDEGDDDFALQPDEEN